MEKFTQNDLDYITDLGNRICKDFISCNGGCPFGIRLKNGGACVLKYVKNYMKVKMTKTNADKFKEVFGFPLYEVHQLSVQEEGEWLEHEYKAPDKIDGE